MAKNKGDDSAKPVRKAAPSIYKTPRLSAEEIIKGKKGDDPRPGTKKWAEKNGLA